MDGAGRMLGSVVHHAKVRGDGCLRASEQVQMGIALSGWPNYISIHWCDVNVEVKVVAPEGQVSAGQILPLFAPNAVMVTVGEMPRNLPPITVGTSVAIGVPVGGLGAHG